MQTAAPQAPTPSANPALPQNVSRPMTRADVQQLQNRRNELSRQLNSATSRRTDVVRDIGRTPNGREGLEARLKVLDERIVQLEKDISQNGQLLASAPPNLVEETTPPLLIGAPGRAMNYTAVSIVFTVLVLFPMTIAWVRRQFRSPMPARELPRDATERLGRIENAVESIAIEVERVSEGQRFVTKLMNDTRQIGAGGAEPIAVRPAEKMPLERKD